MGSRISDILKAFTNALFETHWNLANSRKCQSEIELSNVDALGIWLYAYLIIYSRGVDNHIGVGSDVVCSLGLGNARASVRGIDNRRFHAFFMSCAIFGRT